MRKQTILSHALASISLLASSAVVAHGAIVPPPTTMYINPVSGTLGVDSIQCFLLALLNLVFLIAVPVIVMCIIYAGFLFVSAQANEPKIAKARTVITWTIIGAGVLLGAKAIALAIQTTLISIGPSATAVGALCP